MQYNTLTLGNTTFAFTPWCDPLSGAPITGSKIIDPEGFCQSLIRAIASHDVSSDAVKGQSVLTLDAPETVSCGIGLATPNPEDYVLRAHRGRVNSYLKREHALPTESLRVVLYTRDAYMADPEFTGPINWQPNVDFVVVAVLASSGPLSPRSAYRLVHCLAGGNNEADTWALEDIRAMAREIIAYEDRYSLVSD